MFSFRLLKKSKRNKARLGLLKTPHGLIRTPAFVPVATKGALRGIDFEKTKNLGAEVFMINTFHFYLGHSYRLVKKFGGLHRFLGLNQPLMTDSGGFQVFSLGFGLAEGVGKILDQDRPVQTQGKNLVKITDRGVFFESPFDREKLYLDPERSIRIQKDLGADLIFAFDEFSSPTASYQYTREAMIRTHRWAETSLKTFGKNKTDQRLFGIVQGGEFKDLRQESSQFIGALPFFGFGIGGSLGNTKTKMNEVLDWVVPFLPESKPRHLLGIGEVEDIFNAVKRGVDLFDCVTPTRLARHGAALTRQGRLNLKSGKHRQQKEPLEKTCSCWVCQNLSRAYLSYLVKNKEILGIYYLAWHNLYFIFNLIELIRTAIKTDRLAELERRFVQKLD